MGVLHDCSHWPNPLALSFANGRLLQALEAGGYTEIGAVFYEPHGADSTYSGADDVEFRRRATEGRSSPVYASADGTIVAEVDTRFGADAIWLCSLLADGSVFWTKNALSRQPKMGLTQEQERQLTELHPVTAELIAKAIGVLAKVFDAPGERVGVYPLAREWVTEAPELELGAIEAVHRQVVARQGRGSEPVPAEVAVLVAATHRSAAVAKFHDRFIVFSACVVGGGLVVAAATQLFQWSASWLSALCLMAGLVFVSLIGMVVGTVAVLRLGNRVTAWLPGPWRRGGLALVETARAAPKMEPPV